MLAVMVFHSFWTEEYLITLVAQIVIKLAQYILILIGYSALLVRGFEGDKNIILVLFSFLSPLLTNVGDQL